MSKEKRILALIWIVTSALVYIYIPRNKVKQGLLAFLFKQIITWPVGLFVVERGLIKYPVRLLFNKTNKSSFSFEYYYYPAICAIFNTNYPQNKNLFIKFFYHICYSSILTLLEVILERYTDLITYVKWKWYWSFITMTITFYCSRLFYKWFFNEEISSGRNSISE